MRSNWIILIGVVVLLFSGVVCGINTIPNDGGRGSDDDDDDGGNLSSIKNEEDDLVDFIDIPNSLIMPINCAEVDWHDSDKIKDFVKKRLPNPTDKQFMFISNVLPYKTKEGDKTSILIEALEVVNRERKNYKSTQGRPLTQNQIVLENRIIPHDADIFGHFYQLSVVYFYNPSLFENGAVGNKQKGAARRSREIYDSYYQEDSKPNSFGITGPYKLINIIIIISSDSSPEFVEKGLNVPTTVECHADAAKIERNLNSRTGSIGKHIMINEKCKSSYEIQTTAISYTTTCGNRGLYTVCIEAKNEFGKTRTKCVPITVNDVTPPSYNENEGGLPKALCIVDDLDQRGDISKRKNSRDVNMASIVDYYLRTDVFSDNCDNWMELQVVFVDRKQALCTVQSSDPNPNVIQARLDFNKCPIVNLEESEVLIDEAVTDSIRDYYGTKYPGGNMYFSKDHEQYKKYPDGSLVHYKVVVSDLCGNTRGVFPLTVLFGRTQKFCQAYAPIGTKEISLSDMLISMWSDNQRIMGNRKPNGDKKNSNFTPF